MSAVKLVFNLFVWAFAAGITVELVELTGFFGREAAALHKRGLISIEKYNRKLTD